jgi:hypothetical protein
MFGYHSVTNSADSAMEQPLCWITNDFDRSPSELLWVPKDSAWETLRGSLLNLSYGYGRVYTVPFETVAGQAQGGMCALPIDDLPSGGHRGRFHPVNGQLYVAGMFAWAGNRSADGGFYRIRYVGKSPALMPTALSARAGGLRITFSDSIDATAVQADRFTVKTWDLKRTASYGSKHFNEKTLKVTGATLDQDGRTVHLTIADLAPTWGMSVECRLRDASGRESTRTIHNSVFTLGP